VPNDQSCQTRPRTRANSDTLAVTSVLPRRSLRATPYQSSNKTTDDTATATPRAATRRNLLLTRGGWFLRSAMTALVSSGSSLEQGRGRRHRRPSSDHGWPEPSQYEPAEVLSEWTSNGGRHRVVSRRCAQRSARHVEVRRYAHAQTATRLFLGTYHVPEIGDPPYVPPTITVAIAERRSRGGVWRCRATGRPAADGNMGARLSMMLPHA
jgi:hypothetical protein